MRVRKSGAGIIAGLLWLLAAAPGETAEPPSRAPLETTPHFAFYSDFDANLNDAMIAAGLARKKGKAELFHGSTEEAVCFDKLTAPVKAAWESALSYYAEIVSPADWTDPRQHLIRVQIAGFDEELKDPADRQYVDLVTSFRAAAAPAYAACRWSAQNEKNRRWIQALKPRLAKDEERIAARLEELYRKKWDGLPIPVDVVATVSWSGANSILRYPAGGHLLISTDYEGPAALEVVFHEASHLLMDGKDPVRAALEQAAAEAGVRLPGDLWHVVLFYTTGEAVRKILADGGEQDYKPMLYGIFDRGAWVEYRKPLETAWQPYLEGKRPLEKSCAALIQAIKPPSGGKKP